MQSQSQPLKKPMLINCARKKDTYTESNEAGCMWVLAKCTEPSKKDEETILGDGGMKGRCKVVRHRPLLALWNWISRLTQAAENESEGGRP